MSPIPTVLQLGQPHPVPFVPHVQQSWPVYSLPFPLPRPMDYSREVGERQRPTCDQESREDTRRSEPSGNSVSPPWGDRAIICCSGLRDCISVSVYAYSSKPVNEVSLLRGGYGNRRPGTLRGALGQSQEEEEVGEERPPFTSVPIRDFGEALTPDRTPDRTSRETAHGPAADGSNAGKHGPWPTDHSWEPAYGPRPTVYHGPRPAAHAWEPTNGPRPTVYLTGEPPYGPRPTTHARDTNGPRPTVYHTREPPYGPRTTPESQPTASGPRSTTPESQPTAGGPQTSESQPTAHGPPFRRYSSRPVAHSPP